MSVVFAWYFQQEAWYFCEKRRKDGFKVVFDQAPSCGGVVFASVHLTPPPHCKTRSCNPSPAVPSTGHLVLSTGWKMDYKDKPCNEGKWVSFLVKRRLAAGRY